MVVTAEAVEKVAGGTVAAAKGVEEQVAAVMVPALEVEEAMAVRWEVVAVCVAHLRVAMAKAVGLPA